MLIIRGGKTVECFDSAAESAPPASTSPRTCDTILASFGFSVWSARIESARRIDRPELIIVASWRASTAMSFSGILSPNPGILISLRRPPVFTSVMEIGATPMVFRRLTTAPWLDASIRPLVILPLASRIAYSKTLASAATAHPRLVRAVDGIRPEGGGHALRHVPRATDQSVEVLDVLALLQADLIRDLPGIDELSQVLVHRVHALLGAGLHRRVDLVGLALPDQVPDRRRRQQHLSGHRTTAADPPTQGLADHRLDRAGELSADLFLLVGREHVDDAVDRLGGVLRVQGREHEVTGLGRGPVSYTHLRAHE